MSYCIGPDSDSGLNRQFGTEICSTCNSACENCECCLKHSVIDCEICDCIWKGGNDE